MPMCCCCLCCRCLLLLLSPATPPPAAAAAPQDPFPKPCYLFALVAGDLVVKEDSFTTSSGRQVVLRIYTQPANISQVRSGTGREWVCSDVFGVVSGARVVHLHTASQHHASCGWCPETGSHMGCIMLPGLCCRVVVQFRHVQTASQHQPGVCRETWNASVLGRSVVPSRVGVYIIVAAVCHVCPLLWRLPTPCCPVSPPPSTHPSHPTPTPLPIYPYACPPPYRLTLPWSP